MDTLRKEHDNGIKLAEKRHQETLDTLHKNAKDVEKARSEAEVREENRGVICASARHRNW